MFLVRLFKLIQIHLFLGKPYQSIMIKQTAVDFDWSISDFPITFPPITVDQVRQDLYLSSILYKIHGMKIAESKNESNQKSRPWVCVKLKLGYQ